MLKLLNIRGRVRDWGASRGVCPVCRRAGALRVLNKYMTPRIGFIPTFRFHNEYLAVCGACTAVMAVRRDKARAVARGRRVHLAPGDLRVLRRRASR